MDNLFGKSDGFKSEYCCSIVRIGEVKPIEGKDKIGYTLVNGETIVVRKDMVSEGDVMIYASNETQLDGEFLGANNLFESSSCQLNANAPLVMPYIERNKALREKYDEIEKLIRKVYACSKFLISYSAEVLEAEGDDEKVSELAERYSRSTETIAKYAGSPFGDDTTVKAYIITAQEYCASKKVELDDLRKDIDENLDFIRKHVGFFSKNCRVRAIRLGGIQSMGYLFNLEELSRYNPKASVADIESMVGEDFDTVDGKLFVKAYVPYVPQRGSRGDGKSADRKRNRKIEKFDRMIKGEFSFHYSTDPLPKCINRIRPDMKVTLSSKLHGTSVVIGNIHVRIPVNLPLYQRLWNSFIDLTGLFRNLRVTDYYVDYGNVTSSRTTIRNQYINKNVTQGYYGTDIWSEYGNLLYPFIDEGMTVYGEIIGYLTGSDKMIQSGYDYGCNVGENKIMIYRITTQTPDGSKKEWNVSEVKAWTEKLVEEHPEIACRIHVIDVLYHGTLAELYPQINVETHWHENVLEAMRNDRQRLLMEKDDPFCANKVPYEGIVLRIDDDEFAEAFKLKCRKFLKHEEAEIDNGEVDIETADAFA